MNSSSNPNINGMSLERVGTLVSIAVPLMLAALSGTLMQFIDRIFLAHYSIASMNAAAASGTEFYIFQFSLVSIAAIAEVFVGEHNGANRLDKLAEPVWQMIWFSLATVVIFWPLAKLAPVLLNDAVRAEGLPYMRTLCWFGPFYPLAVAISSFFIGQGKSRLVTIIVLIGNLVNFSLDIPLIFGWGNIIQAHGTHGAALASGISQALTAILLFAAFIQPKYQRWAGTLRTKINFQVMRNCLTVATPPALGHVVGIIAWAIIMQITAGVSIEHMMVLTISQTVWMLFTFLEEGSQKAITTVTANALGANAPELVPRIFRSSAILMSMIMIVLAVPFLLFPEVFVKLVAAPDITISQQALLFDSLRWIWTALVFDSVMWICIAILLAHKDTTFIMIVNGLGSWVLSLLPQYIFIILLKQPPIVTVILFNLFTGVNAIVYYWRYQYKAKELDWEFAT